MGQETGANTLGEIPDNQKTSRMLSVYKTLAFGWIVGAIVFLFVTRTLLSSDLIYILKILQNQCISIAIKQAKQQTL